MSYEMVECPRCHGSGLEDYDEKTGQRPACRVCGGIGQVPK